MCDVPYETSVHTQHDVEPAAILVGAAQSWLPELVDGASRLKVNGGFEKDTDLLVYQLYACITRLQFVRGPLISPQAKSRVIGLIESAVFG